MMISNWGGEGGLKFAMKSRLQIAAHCLEKVQYNYMVPPTPEQTQTIFVCDFIISVDSESVVIQGFLTRSYESFWHSPSWYLR